jgi:ribosomal-protein-alanine N-acetyltransferase
MTTHDWRDASAHEIEELLTAEVDRWRRRLDWDIAEAWRAVGPARVSGVLPGALVRDRRGRIAGWTWFLLHGESLQIGSIVADRAEVTAALVVAALESREARCASRVAVCVREAAPGLREILASRGFDVVDYEYLSRPAGGGDHRRASDVAAHRPWSPDDIVPAATLCAKAYGRGEGEGIRAFAPGGTREEWQDYVAGLALRSSCGAVIGDASRVVDRAPGGVAGFILTTSIAPSTAHVAQVAVDPEAQGQGVGRHLLASALEVVDRQGFARTTLLVSAANARARAMYAAFGFLPRASFVVAVRASRPAMARRVPQSAFRDRPGTGAGSAGA